jgi:hypothetical protein
MDTNAIFGALLGAGIALMVVYFLIMLLMLISTWIIFEKAKQPGWAILIPIYNILVMLRVAKLHWAWIFMILAAIIPIVGTFAVLIFFGIIVPIKISKNFGQSSGFAVGMILLPYIFYPILAFNKNMQYVDNEGEPVTVEKITSASTEEETKAE